MKELEDNKEHTVIEITFSTPIIILFGRILYDVFGTVVGLCDLL